MKLGNRLFPYPLLNKDKTNSSYGDSEFSFNYVKENDGEFLILKNLNIELKSNFIRSLLKNNTASLYCAIEFPAAFYREHFNISLENNVIKIPLNNICGKGTISVYIVANEDIASFCSDEFSNEYDGVSVVIEKFDIIAIDDGYIEVVEFESSEDVLKSSIFSIIKNFNEKENNILINYDKDKIEISLPMKEWDIYNTTKKQKYLENLYFAILAIPALSKCLNEVKKEIENSSFDFILTEYKWFNIFIEKYNELFSNKFTNADEFIDSDCYLCAQQVLNCAVTKSLDDIRTILTGDFGGLNNED